MSAHEHSGSYALELEDPLLQVLGMPKPTAIQLVSGISALLCIAGIATV